MNLDKFELIRRSNNTFIRFCQLNGTQVSICTFIFTKLLIQLNLCHEITFKIISKYHEFSHEIRCNKFGPFEPNKVKKFVFKTMFNPFLFDFCKCFRTNLVKIKLIFFYF